MATPNDINNQANELRPFHFDLIIAWLPAEDPLIARRRHLASLERVDHHLRAAVDQAKGRATELLAEELRLAQTALGEITGVVTTEDLLGQIFSSFCIGK